jgi:hypothetical protein
MVSTQTQPQIVKTISLDFGGYWMNPERVPRSAGIYCVYACQHHGVTVNIRSLLYIGESEAVRIRIGQHLADDTGKAWKRHLRVGEVFCYSQAKIGADREQAEAALVFWHKPPTNTERVNEFPYPRTRIVSNGRIPQLNPDFAVG